MTSKTMIVDGKSLYLEPLDAPDGTTDRQFYAVYFLAGVHAMGEVYEMEDGDGWGFLDYETDLGGDGADDLEDALKGLMLEAFGQ